MAAAAAHLRRPAARQGRGWRGGRILLATVAVSGFGLVRGEGEGSDTSLSPINKVLELMEGMQKEIIKDGEAVHKEYAEYSKWCQTRSRDLAHSEKLARATIDKLSATIADKTAILAARTAKVEELGGSIASLNDDLKLSTAERAQEAEEFQVEQTDLVQTVDMLRRASSIIEKELKEGGSLLQEQGADRLLSALATMLEATSISTSDAERLQALLQKVQDTQDNMDDPLDDALDRAAADSDVDNKNGNSDNNNNNIKSISFLASAQPSGPVYAKQSKGVSETLEDLLDKAESQLNDIRRTESTSLSNFKTMKLSLENQIKVATKEMEAAKKDIAEAQELKSVAGGDLDVSKKDLSMLVDSKDTLHHECTVRAQEYQAETKSRSDELEAVAKAKKIISEQVTTTGDDVGESGDAAVSFVQVATTSGMDTRLEVVKRLRTLARDGHSEQLALIAKRMSSTLHSTGPFPKVQKMIESMLTKLEAESQAQASKKSWCDDELRSTQSKTSDKKEDLDKLTTDLDSSTARSSQLKSEINDLNQELSQLLKSQAEMDKMRAAEKATFEASSAEIKSSLKGVQRGMKVLNDYYGASGSSKYEKSGGAAGVIGLLEVIESDLQKNLAEITAEEESELANYDTATQKNRNEKRSIETDVIYKTRESKGLDKTSSELSADQGSTQEEYDALSEYYTKIQSECTGRVSSYEERKKLRDNEIAGLHEALASLGGSGVSGLLQKQVARKSSLRGTNSLAPDEADA